jgi:hypothetical protein
MKRNVVIESECAVSSLDFPMHLDHAWLFIAAGIHLRLFDRTPDNSFVGNAVRKIERIDERSYVLVISDARRWTDGAPVLTNEVAMALSRGRRAGIFASVSPLYDDRILVQTRGEAELHKELLASPLFTVTPSCRGIPGTATCGPFLLEHCSADKRLMKFRKRRDPETMARGPDEVTIVVTKSRSQGLRLMRAGRIALSCPLGADPASFSELDSSNTISNRLTNLGLVLRPYSGCILDDDRSALATIGRTLRRDDLARLTANTFVPLESISALFHQAEIRSRPCRKTHHRTDDPETQRPADLYRGPKSIELRYASFEPNRTIAIEVKGQLHRSLGIRCSLVPVSYDDYVASRFPKTIGLSLEIVQPLLPENLCRAQWDFLEPHSRNAKENDPPGIGVESISQTRQAAVPLLQCVTSLISLDPRYKGRHMLTSEALLEWSIL